MEIKLKKVIMIIGFSCFLSACGTPQSENVENKISIATDIQMDHDETGEVVLEETSYEVSDKQLTIEYKGQSFEKSVFAVGGNSIYICGRTPEGEYFVGGMEKEADELNIFPINFLDGMRIFNMTVDTEEKCHILWMSVESIEIEGEQLDAITFEKSLITILDSNGKEEKTIDVSDVFAMEQCRPQNLVVDKEENYYFMNQNEIVRFDREGKIDLRIPCDGYLEGIGCGKSGIIYCTYSNDYGEILLGYIDKDQLQSCEVILPEADAYYANLSAGTDTELLLYNLMGGIYVYDNKEKSLEQRVAIDKMPLPGEDVGGYGFLGDGRLCLISQVSEQTNFYYVPAGK